MFQITNHYWCSCQGCQKITKITINLKIYIAWSTIQLDFINFQFSLSFCNLFWFWLDGLLTNVYFRISDTFLNLLTPLAQLEAIPPSVKCNFRNFLSTVMAGGPHRNQSAANEPGHHLLLPYEHLIIDSKNVPWCKILVLSTISVKKLNTNTMTSVNLIEKK